MKSVVAVAIAFLASYTFAAAETSSVANDARSPALTETPPAVHTLKDTELEQAAPLIHRHLSNDWQIDFGGVVANFTINSTDELCLTYYVTKKRDHDVLPLYKSDCKTPINKTEVGINVTFWQGPYDTYRDKLIVKYSIDKSMIANSSIYNETTSELQVCQEVHLVTKAPDPVMVIAQDTRRIDVNFNLAVNYNATMVGGDSTNFIPVNEKTNINFNSYIAACMCDQSGSSCVTELLAPNDELYICVYSKSNDVGIGALNTMYARQGSTSVSIVEEPNAAKYPLITELNKQDSMMGPGEGYLVSTYLPINEIFYGLGSTIDITGEVGTSWEGSRARKLQDADSAIGAGGDADTFAFNLVVALKPESDTGPDTLEDSAGMVAINGLDLFGLVLFTLSYMIMW